MRLSMFIILLLSAGLIHAETVHIAVATNFKSTAKKINTLFEQKSAHTAVLSSASTGTLYSQITHGAPFDIFFSADKNAPLRLEENQLGVNGQQFCYAMGGLTLVGSDNAAEDLANPRLSLAIANPKTAPYGRAALQVIQRREFKAASNRKLVRANNAIQAYQHWHSSSVDLALVPNSLAAGEGAAISSNWYTPIEQHVIWLKRANSNPAAKAYMRLIRSEEVQTMIQNTGYGTCP
ncbi:MAG: molybdate transport system substrate-binding protein [Halioglobus sp.]|jgi:molybdate transport system substrate-binding protein